LKTLTELRQESEGLELEAMQAGLALKEAAERADLETEIKTKKARIRAAKFAESWARFQPIAEARRWRMGRIAVGEGDKYSEIFFRHANEAEIKARPDTDEEARTWLLGKVMWYPPAGDGEVKEKELRSWIDNVMIDYPATWATLMAAVMALSVETAEIVRGKV